MPLIEPPLMPIMPPDAGVSLGKSLAFEVHLRARRKAGEIQQQVRALARAPA